MSAAAPRGCWRVGSGLCENRARWGPRPQWPTVTWRRPDVVRIGLLPSSGPAGLAPSLPRPRGDGLGPGPGATYAHAACRPGCARAGRRRAAPSHQWQQGAFRIGDATPSQLRLSASGALTVTVEPVGAGFRRGPVLNELQVRYTERQPPMLKWEESRLSKKKPSSAAACSLSADQPINGRVDGSARVGGSGERRAEARA
jgi:hypothetical protein